jgi:predicted SAM-dependent methyltransferase
MKLDIGCGLNLKTPVNDWVHLDGDAGPNIDIVTDFGNIPLDDNSVDEIWIGDVIEHVPVWRQTEVLAEWRRILKPHGILGGTTPNLEYNIQQYVKKEIDPNWLLQNLYGDRAGPPHQHYILFTMQTLNTLLTGHGFNAVDYSGSPGNKSNPWWLVFKTTKVG